MRNVIILLLLVVLFLAAGYAMREQPDPKALTAGTLTHFELEEAGFVDDSRRLPKELRESFQKGKQHFEREYVLVDKAALGGIQDGLGPLFNAESCESCHKEKGRTKPSIEDGSLMFRLSIPGEDKFGGPEPHGVYGSQFATKSVGYIRPEGDAKVAYEELPGMYADGEKYTLRKPIYSFHNLGYREMGDDVMVSPRAAPGVYGVGLLEAISSDTILAMADEDDADGDGISGKANIVWDMHNQRRAVGRFGWKAEQNLLINVAAAATHHDIGVSNPVFPMQNCAAPQLKCGLTQTGEDNEYQPHEITMRQLEQIESFLRGLGVPGRRDVNDPEVARGEALFAQAKCSSCHRTNLKTSDKHPVAELRGQMISPYTDLLLHDMGEGLADNRPTFKANAREWRTHPLWGIGAVEQVNGHTEFLHDGRARNLEEAILWHGGEAEMAKEFFRALPKEDREAMVAFLNSL